MRFRFPQKKSSLPPTLNKPLVAIV